ncbi:MAG: hypothetical protein HKN36_10060 [Hellea sp.]|nr:hypothetical protein [Hellea sp.]
MNILLCAIVWSVAILFVLIAVQATSGISNNGMKWGFGARDSSKDDTMFQARTKRTVANHIEGMLLFVPLALVAYALKLDGDMIVKGAWLYLIARALYPLTYWTGLPYARTLVWFVSIVGTAMIFFQIVTSGTAA